MVGGRVVFHGVQPFAQDVSPECRGRILVCSGHGTSLWRANFLRELFVDGKVRLQRMRILCGGMVGTAARGRSMPKPGKARPRRKWDVDERV